MKPGVQNPHCRASCAMKAFCTGCSLTAPMPSTVVTDLSAAARAGIRQLTTGAPSSSTVHAPQTPAPHTSLVPVRLRASRTTSISSASGSSGRGSMRPLIVIVPICDLQVLRGIFRGESLYQMRLRRRTGEERIVEKSNLKDTGEVGLGCFDLIGREKHPRRAFAHMPDPLRRWRGRCLEDERLKQRRLTHLHELRSRQFA